MVKIEYKNKYTFSKFSELKTGAWFHFYAEICIKVTKNSYLKVSEGKIYEAKEDFETSYIDPSLVRATVTYTNEVEYISGKGKVSQTTTNKHHIAWACGVNDGEFYVSDDALYIKCGRDWSYSFKKGGIICINDPGELVKVVTDDVKLEVY